MSRKDVNRKLGAEKMQISNYVLMKEASSQTIEKPNRSVSLSQKNSISNCPIKFTFNLWSAKHFSKWNS